MSPLMAWVHCAGTPASSRMLLMRPSTSTPVSAPNTVPLPPSRLTPPMTAAAKTVKIMPWPWLAATEPSRPTRSRPASAASRPPMAYTNQTTRSVRMPAALAASTLPPMAYSERPWRRNPSATMPIA